MEQNIILLGGKPGSGKSHLGRELAARLNDEIRVEHMSFGDHVRLIGGGVLESMYYQEIIAHLNSEHPDEPIANDLAYDLVDESLQFADQNQVDLVLLDGYPRYEGQVNAIYQLAADHKRALGGMLVTDVRDATALQRMLKRDKRDANRHQGITPDEAHARLHLHETSFRHVRSELTARHLPIEIIDTSKSKKATTMHGLLAARYMLSHSETLSDSA